MRVPTKVLATMALLFWGVSFLERGEVSSREVQEEGIIEIVIRDSVFEFHGGIIKPGEPATIFLINMDKVRHGFTSSLFSELDVAVGTDSGESYGSGIQGIYINPGKQMQIRFTPSGQGKHTFRCDLHPKMKGELLVLSVGSV